MQMQMHKRPWMVDLSGDCNSSIRALGKISSSKFAMLYYTFTPTKQERIRICCMRLLLLLLLRHLEVFTKTVAGDHIRPMYFIGYQKCLTRQESGAGKCLQIESRPISKCSRVFRRTLALHLSILLLLCWQYILTVYGTHTTPLRGFSLCLNRYMYLAE